MAQPQRPKAHGWAIRDDGMLYPALDAILRKPNYRPYHGDINASHEERMRYLQGFAQRDEAKLAAERGQFNIATADKDALVDFILDEYGYQLDTRTTLDKMRNEAIQVVQGNIPGATPPAEAPAVAKRKAAGMKIPTLADVQE